MRQKPQHGRTCLLAAALAALACTKPFDGLALCIFPASDRVVVEVSASCASDHKGAELSCSIERVGDELHVKTQGHDGKDPNDACAADLTATCESEVLPDGEYTVVFGDETFPVTIPNTEDSCDSDDV